MTDILQDRIGLGNLQPLPSSLNSSKGAQIAWSEYKRQPLNAQYKANLMKEQMYLEGKIQDQIRAYQKINRTR